MYLSKSTATSLTIIRRLRKNISLLISNIYNTEHVRFYLPYQSVSLCSPSQSVPSTSSHSLPTFPTSSLPFHNISSLSSNALDIQRLLKPFNVTSHEMYCHAVMIHMDYIIHLNFFVYKLLAPTKMTFSTDGVNNFKYLFWISLFSLQSEFMALCMVFNLWICPGFILSLVVNV